MARRSPIQWLASANGWQRVWFVCSVLCVLYYTIIFPLSEVNKDRMHRYERLWATEKEMLNPICAPYMNSEFMTLREPPYSKDGSTCYHIYSHRKYSGDDRPITVEGFTRHFNSQEREMWLSHIAVGALVATIFSMLLYGVGMVVAWIRRGFNRG